MIDTVTQRTQQVFVNESYQFIPSLQLALDRNIKENMYLHVLLQGAEKVFLAEGA